MKEIVVDKVNDSQRIEKFVRNYLNDAPLSFIYKLFRKKDVKVNGHWVEKTYILHEKDVVKIFVTDEQMEDFSKPREAIKKDFPYEIIFENKEVLIANKPKGLLVYGDDKGNKNTLTNAVLDYLYFKGEYDPANHTFTPSPAHRLDRNTSGLVIFGKTESSLSQLTELFKTREGISKKYLTLVLGTFDTPYGEISKPLRKDPVSGLVSVCSTSKGGKPALTKYKVEKSFSSYSLLEVDLVTGRTHQIRVHMASINHPVVGDNKYGDFKDCKEVANKFKLTSQFLHAYKMEFGNLGGSLKNIANKTFIAPLPVELKKIIDKIN